jgi:hypothetical protein
MKKDTPFVFVFSFFYPWLFVISNVILIENHVINPMPTFWFVVGLVSPIIVVFAWSFIKYRIKKMK